MVTKQITCVHMKTNHVPKDVSERDSALSWFESLILAFVNAKLFQIRLLKREKGVFWIVIRIESLILGHVNAKLFQNVIRVHVHFGNARWSNAEAMHGSISADWAVGTKYYLAVCRSWSWLGRRLQCMWTHVVQITIPIAFWIAIRNVFRNVICSHVNTAPEIFDNEMDIDNHEWNPK